MQTLRSIKRRIRSISGTMKITRALKMISAAKLKRFQTQAVNAKIFRNKFREIALQVAAKDGEIEHPAFIPRHNIRQVIVIVISVDKGFCGGLGDQMAKQIKQYLDIARDREISVRVLVMGNKSQQSFKKNKIDFKRLNISYEGQKNHAKIERLCRQLLKLYLTGNCDQVVIAYNNFNSVISHESILESFLPVWVKEDERSKLNNMIDFIYEPEKGKVLADLLAETLKQGFIGAALESFTSEQAARMVAMDEAYKNGQDISGKLKRKYNQLRQSAITRELIDIIGGAEVLNG